MSRKNSEENEEARQLAELERRLAETQRELEARDEIISGLERAIAARDSQAEELKQQAAKATGNSERLQGQLSEALAGYLALTVEVNPQLPPELITGDTVAAIKDSLEKARNLVGKVKQGLEAEAAASRIPAGAPGRTPPDLSGLSPSQKIKYAIGGK